MADDEKPFRCYQPDCGMRFTNEDHLSVHIKKHDMSLALNLGMGLGGLSPMGLCDQTPTPTKFLKNCEELGLFQELSKENPFDDSFKKALDVPEDEPDTSCLPGPGGILTLDTPLPTTLPKIVTDNSFDEDNKSPTKTRDNTLSSIVPKKREKFLSSHVLPTSTTSEEDDEIPTTSSSNTGNNVEPMEEILADSVDELLGDGAEVIAVSSSEVEPMTEMRVGTQTVNTVMANESKPAVVQGRVTMQALLQLPNGQTIPVQLPGSVLGQPQVIPVPTVSLTKNFTAVPQNTFHGNVQGNTQYMQTVPTNFIQQKPLVQGSVPNLPGTIHSLPVGLVQNSTNRIFPLQPVKLGPSPLAQTSQVQTVNQSLVTTVISPEKQTETQNPGIKTVIAPQIVVQSAQKRTVISPKSQSQSTSKTSPVQGSQTYTKQRLKAALQQNVTPSSSMKINHIFKIVEEVKQEQQLSQDSLSVASDSLSSPDDSPSPAKQMRTEVEDSEEKRKKFLERNRAAAARCRQKRKSWVYNLESKADELSSVNNKLQTEIKALRGEVAHLKQLLIAHKDCPITIQQQSQGQMLPQNSPAEGSQSSDIDIEPIEILPAINGDMNNTSGIPNVITVDPGAMGNNVSMATSVFTGPNSIAMIPTIVNLDFYAKKEPS